MAFAIGLGSGKPSPKEKSSSERDYRALAAPDHLGVVPANEVISGSCHAACP